MAWLYPYDGTVFPGGVAAPTLQWSPSATGDAIDGGTGSLYVHLHARLFDYKGCFATKGRAQTLSASVWSAAFAQNLGAADPLTIDLATSHGGGVDGAIRETVTLAPGALRGAIYYDTYGSKLTASSNGAIMRVTPAATQPTVFLSVQGASPFGPCVGCHSVSANASILATQEQHYPGTKPLSGKGSMTFDLATAPDPSAPLANVTTDDWGLSAVYPDGSLLLTSGEPGDTSTTVIFPGAPTNNPGMTGPLPSRMYDTRTAAPVAFSGLSATYAMMPMFSPDGKHVVYNDFDAGNGHSLVMMDFDFGTKAFSNARTLFQGTTKQYPGWPSFTPDARSVVFSVGNGNNFASVVSPPSTFPLNDADLYVVDVATATAHALDQVNGFKAGVAYLPSGTRDEHGQFYPMMSPVVSGGYAWVFFTSRRTYGNLQVGSVSDPGSKAIWAAAIDLDAGVGTDPSHPAFYLPGQELTSGNYRAVPALIP